MRTAIDTQRTRVLPYLVLGISLAATIATTVASHRSAVDRDHARFRNAVQSADDRIHNRLDTYVAVLLAARGLVVAAPDVDRQAFKRFVDELELERRYPGIQGIGFSLRLAPADRAALERRMAAQGDPSFRVWPDGDRSELHSILFLEPLDRRNQA